MMTICRVVSAAVVIGSLLSAVTGCSSLYRESCRKLYPGPTRDPSELAVVFNDDNVFVHPRWCKSVAILPGTQELNFDYYMNVGYGYYHSIKPYPLKVTVFAGHRYQVVGYDGAFQFMPSLVDITTQSNVWAYYKSAPNESHAIKAVIFMSEQEQLIEVARTCPKPAARREAVARIEESTVLSELMKDEIDASVREAISLRLKVLAGYVIGEQGAFGRKKSSR